MDSIPIAEIVHDRLDAIPGLDHLGDCVPMLEAAFDHWQENGAASNFELIVAAASPYSANIFHSSGWPDADGRCEPALARRAVLFAIGQPTSTETTNVIAAGLSLLLGPNGRARQQHDAAEVRKAGSVPLVVALLAPAGGEVETMVSTIAVVPRGLH